MDSRYWFDLRDAAERFSEAVLPEVNDSIRRIAFVEFSWHERRSGEMRIPKVTKRFAPAKMD